MARYYYGLTFATEKEKEKFIEKVYKVMNEKNITVKELAEMTGYSVKSVYQFFSDLKIANKFLAASIADKLKIE